MSRDTQLESDLKDWAEWIENIDGYSRSTTISRAMAGQMDSGSFSSNLPKGVEPGQRYLQRMVLAMADCSAVPKKAKYILAMQLYYLIGGEQVSEIMDTPGRTIRRWRRRGEDILRREMQS